MFLKSVELFGFKSFADRSLIEFTGGISALLGPNGCGKSNVVDAIKWVLGEQATRSLRADRMEDLIFNGTETRKALNVAEVTLTLSNGRGVLPIDMEEISIKRRLHRSGESEYFINATPVKLKELRELFYDTGIGKTAYSIMEQGKIDQVLSNKPEERRIIFEEAATITKYKVKGQEAERKLERTEENVRQVEGILGEVRRSYESLKIQCDKTLRYRRLRDEVFDIELDVNLLRLKAFIETKDGKATLLKDRIARRDSVKTAIDGINESLEKNLDVVNSMEARLIENQKALYGVELELTNLDTQERLHVERIGELESKAAADRAREKNLADKIAVLEKSIAEKRGGLEDFSRRVAEYEAHISAFGNDIRLAEIRIAENTKNIGARETRIRELEQANEQLQNELRMLTDAIVAELDFRLRDSGYSYQEHKRLEESIQNALQGLRISLEGKANLFGDKKVLHGESGQIGGDLGAVVTLLRDTLARVESLSVLFADFSRLLPSFLDEFLAPQGIITKKRELDGAVESNRGEIRQNRSAIEDLRADSAVLSGRISEYRTTLEELRLNKVRMKTQMDGIEETLGLLERERLERSRLKEDVAKEIAASHERVIEFGRRIETLRASRSGLREKEKATRAALAELESSINERNKDLVEKERGLKSMMEELGRSQTSVERLQMELAELNTEIKNLYDNFRERYSRDLSEFESRMYEIATPTKDLRERLAEARDEQKKLGSVNLMAPEEFAEIKERYDFLTGQLEDLRKAREDLKRVTQEIRTESAELFLETYEQIRKNFHVMFRRLFGGGRAELKLSDPDNVLESGIEIFVQPPGKKLENIALLSGGERSLTAVSLLFATYMVKPSPFCLLDEIDAALDENNVGRFVSMLNEFGKVSQFIVVTHNKKTVAGAATLLGVTMEESGVSKVVSIRINSDDDRTEEEGEPA